MRYILLFLPAMFSCFAQEANFAGEIEPLDLKLFEKRIFSQGGEDGIVEIFFSLVDPEARFCVDVGASDGYSLSNTYHLRKNKGWKALLIDRNYENRKIDLHRELVTAENINDLLAKYGVPDRFDFLSIDVDFNDFHLWRALDNRYQPALVCIEFNNSLGPTSDRTVIYNAMGAWDGTNYFGASAAALHLLARFKGYSLIYIEKNGINCFFARDDLLETLKTDGIVFKDVNNLPKLFVDNRFSFPKDPMNRPFALAKELIGKESVSDRDENSF